MATMPTAWYGRTASPSNATESTLPNTGIKWMNRPARSGPTSSTPRLKNRNDRTDGKMPTYANDASAASPKRTGGPVSASTTKNGASIVMPSTNVTHKNTNGSSAGRRRNSTEYAA